MYESKRQRTFDLVKHAVDALVEHGARRVDGCGWHRGDAGARCQREASLLPALLRRATLCRMRTVPPSEGVAICWLNETVYEKR